MTKRKNPADNWLPSRVYRGKSAYEWHPKKGGAIRLTTTTGETIRARLRGEETTELKAEVWAAYKRARFEPSYLVKDLVREYHNSPQFSRLAAGKGSTQENYQHYSKRVLRVFGHMAPDDVRPAHIRAFMDKLGEAQPVSANRHHSYMSTLFGWGLERDKCSTNPAKSVRKFPETPRDRYIEDWEMALYLQVARESSSTGQKGSHGYPWLAPAAEIAYLCRMRSVEVRALTESEILDEGVFVGRAKGSENEITQWSARLRAAVNEIRAVYPNAPVSLKRPLFHTRKGAPLTASAFKSAHKRIMDECIRRGMKERFSFHDFKAKGITDHTENYGGHRDRKMQAVYNRKPKPRAPTR